MGPAIFAARLRSIRIYFANLNLGFHYLHWWKLSFVVLIALLIAGAGFTSSATSSSDNSPLEVSSVRGETIGFDISSPPVAELNGFSLLRMAGISLFSPAPQMPPMVATYAGDCTTPKTVFNVQDTDKTVCAKVANAVPGWRVIWSNADFVAVQTNTLTSSNQDVTFTLTTSSNLGDWRVILFEPFGGTVQAVTSFTVIDAQNPVADLIVNKGAISSPVSAGGQVLFGIEVTNGGPSPSANVELTDAVPANTTFVSFAQLDGPVFNCTSPMAGSNSGSTVCSIGSLARGEKAIFLATFEVDAGTPAGTEISNTATVASVANGQNNPATPDSNTDNNLSTDIATVAATPCTLTCPSNITVPADSGQSGAVVTYSSPSSTGSCGEISCNPASGSFFPVGTTTVICAGETGNACTFQVTVENPGALSISLVGADPFALECGTDFDDPGAAAVNGNGDPVPVTVSGTVDNHTPGSYTLTYTATEGENSVSTTRTVNVSDSEVPVITLHGENPMTLSCGQTFVDPGASANDACEGAKSVNSSGSVDSNTPGTYTITYTASDSLNHLATATRKVIVEEGGGTAPPTITLNGDPQMTIECGTAFVDPGATATAPCGGSLPVTTSGTVDHQTPGTYTITYTACVEQSPGVCDPNRTSQAERTVTVEDTVAPVIALNGPDPLTHECHTPFTDPGATAQDACEGTISVSSTGGVDENTVGSYTITYTASDSGGRTTTKTRTVNVVDTTPPTVNDPPDVTVSTGSGSTTCGAFVSDAQLGTATANDACDGAVSVTRSGVPAGNNFSVGQTTVTYSATDGHGNTGTATQIVTVIDNTPPTISCPANITLEPTCPSGAIATWTEPVGTDNCASTTTRTGPAPGSVFPIGTTTVAYTVTDASNNTASCSFTVTVLTPQAVVQNLINAVNALTGLSGQQRQGLLSKLQAALDAINQGKTNVACNKLSDFINQVQSFINNGTLTSAQGQPLIDSAAHVRNTLGCTSLPCT